MPFKYYNFFFFTTNVKTIINSRDSKFEHFWRGLWHIKIISFILRKAKYHLFSLRTESDNPDATCELSP